VCIERSGVDSASLVDASPVLAPHKRNIFLVPPTVSNDVSSTLIRKCATNGKSLKYLVPDPVITYIKQHKLYMP
jgi:nicotinamide mononucleotide adenylyltransferase